MFKLIIAGGRDFSNINIVKESLEMILREISCEKLVVVSGCAAGADTIGAIVARSMGIVVKEFPAQWDKYGKSAGYRRNTEMAKYADALLAFWDGRSGGTEHMIKEAYLRDLKVSIVQY